MSDLDDLGEIADQCRISHTGEGLIRLRFVRCNSPGHMKGENVRVYRTGKNGKIRTVCKLCDKARRAASNPTRAEECEV